MQKPDLTRTVVDLDLQRRMLQELQRQDLTQTRLMPVQQLLQRLQELEAPRVPQSSPAPDVCRALVRRRRLSALQSQARSWAKWVRGRLHGNTRAQRLLGIGVVCVAAHVMAWRAGGATQSAAATPSPPTAQVVSAAPEEPLPSATPRSETGPAQAASEPGAATARPQADEPLQRRAIDAMAQGSYDDALELYAQLVQRYPKSQTYAEAYRIAELYTEREF